MIGIEKYRPRSSDELLASADWSDLQRQKEWYPKEVQAHLLLLFPQGMASVIPRAVDTPPGFRRGVATYQNQRIRWGYDKRDFEIIAEWILDARTSHPTWIDEYTYEFFERTRTFIALAEETTHQFVAHDVAAIRAKFCEIVDALVAVQSYGYLTEVFTVTAREYWVTAWLKRLAPALNDTERESLMEPGAPSFLNVYQQRLALADTDAALQAVWQDFYWIKGSYWALPVLTLDDLRRERKAMEVSSSEDFDERARRKQALCERVSDPQGLCYAVRVIERCIAMQDERKANVLRGNYALFKLAQMIQLRHPEWSIKELLSFTPLEILRLVDGTLSPDQRLLISERNRKSGWVFTPEWFCLSSDTRVVEPLFELFEEKIGEEVRGYPASRGTIRGIAKIVVDERDFAKMRPGDILIAPMTRPEFLPVMRQAAAFVTDEGGITCHAAIISREMGKPCVIGTKQATRTFHDGDFIEVDAEQGVVKILKRA